MSLIQAKSFSTCICVEIVSLIDQTALCVGHNAKCGPWNRTQKPTQLHCNMIVSIIASNNEVYVKTKWQIVSFVFRMGLSCWWQHSSRTCSRPEWVGLNNILLDQPSSSIICKVVKLLLIVLSSSQLRPAPWVYETVWIVSQSLFNIHAHLLHA